VKKSIFWILCYCLFACKAEVQYQPQTINQLYSVVLPSYMVATKSLNDEASLQYQATEKEFYIVILDEPKSNIAAENNLRLHYDDTILKVSNTGLANPKVKAANAIKINGLDGLQTEVVGSFKNLQVFYLVTVLESNSHYYQILTWTLDNNRQKIEPEMRKILDSFKQIKS
jgi:hypothetical protein